MAKRQSAWACAVKAILSILFAALLAFGGTVAGWFAHKDNWFELAEKTEDLKEDPEDPKEDPTITQPKTFRFEAEDGFLQSCNKVAGAEEQDRAYVGDFTDNSTVTFELEADNATEAEMKVSITSPKEDAELTDFLKITVNQEPYTTKGITAKGAGDAKWSTWQEVEAGTITLEKGINTIAFNGIFDGCNFDWFELTVKGAEISVKRENGGMSMPKETNDDNIALMSAMIPLALYEEYGVSPVAETAQTITATIKPNNEGENTGVIWNSKWKDPASSWATGKTLEEYLTVTPKGESAQESKIVTVQCLQPFGEQIVITVTSTDNPEVSAEVAVDYARKVENLSLSFGDIECDFDSGETNVVVEINPTGTPDGGETQLSVTYSETYTIDNLNKTTKISLVDPNDFFLLQSNDTGSSVVGNDYFCFCSVKGTSRPSPTYTRDYNLFQAYDIQNRGLYFGFKYFADNLNFKYCSGNAYSSDSSSDLYGEYYSVSVSTIIEMYNATDSAPDGLINNGYDHKNVHFGKHNEIFSLTLNVAEKIYKTTFYMSGYTNQSTVNEVETDRDSIVF